MSVSAGDFLEVYAKEDAGTFDAVITCFFLDTMANPMEAMDVIHARLRPGGVWINFGGSPPPPAASHARTQAHARAQGRSCTTGRGTGGWTRPTTHGTTGAWS